MATHSSILAWRTPWTEESGRLQSIVLESQTRLKQLSMHTSTESKYQLNCYIKPQKNQEKAKTGSLEKTKQKKKLVPLLRSSKNNRERHKLLILQMKGAISIDILDIKIIIRKY